MINFIPHNQIDRSKYDACIKNSKSRRVYAFSWYLDTVCETWDVLVKGDYEVVMPVPKRRKYGFTYVITPAWVQQLGIFSSEDIPVDEIEIFKGFLDSNFHWIDYHFNAANQVSDKRIEVKKNYLIPLEGEMGAILKNYNKNRRRASSGNFNQFVLDKEGDPDLFFKHYQNMEKPYKLEEDVLNKLYRLTLGNTRSIRVWNVFEGKDFTGGLIWVKDEERITYLLPVANEKAKKENVPTFIINELIKDHLNQGLILDFEGSMLKGVANFYKSFGAIEENYYFFKKRFL
ncbi:MAG: hypothetical protein JSV73_08600 [Flavobacteriaceae bacterium]|nr:MAG: hypothetical protein JSV73_08600 [Flavobacteriaceae bacterium]